MTSLLHIELPTIEYMERSGLVAVSRGPFIRVLYTSCKEISAREVWGKHHCMPWEVGGRADFKENLSPLS